LTYYSGYYPLLNIWKQAANIEIFVDGAKHRSNIPAGVEGSAWQSYLDNEGELVSPLPPGVTHLTRLFFAPSPDSNAAGFSRAAERWVLKWDGIAREVSISGADSQRRAGNRIEWVWANNNSGMWVTFTKMGTDNPPRNIRLCAARHEALLDAGQLFNPEWTARVREASGTIRFMDWQATNSNRSTLRAADIPSPSYFGYGQETGTPYIRGGMPLLVMSTLANEVQSHPWVCIPVALGTHKLSGIKTISNGTAAVVSAPGHIWEDGDRVIPYGTNWPKIERGIFTVKDSNPAAGTFVLAGVDSSNFGSYSSTWASLTSPLDLDKIATEVALFAAHFRDTIAPPLVTYFELGNELWNWMFNAPSWLAAQARHKLGSDDNNKMAGYLAAHCMRVVRDTYGPSNRGGWRGVLATQTVNPGVTNGMLAGIRQYIADIGAPFAVSDLFDDLAVTGYWGGPFTNENKARVLGWMDASEQRWQAGQEPTKYSYFNRVVNEDCADARHTGQGFSLDKIVGFWKAQKKIADANGLGFIQYEGGNHNDPKFFGALTESEQKRFMEFYKQCTHTAEDAANYVTMFESFAAMGGKYPSKFVEAGPVTRYGNWGGLRHLADRNPVWDAVVAFNGRS